MATEVKSPTFPESVADGTIANWVKKEGETVQQDEVIAEIETDKVVLEVVAPFDGVISKIYKHAGEIVQSAELIAEFEKVSDHSSDNEAEQHPEPTLKTEVAPKQRNPKEEEKLNGPAATRLLKENTPNIKMETPKNKTTFIYESFSEFINSISNELVTEAFGSQRLAELFRRKSGKLDKHLASAFYGSTKVALDKVQDEDLITSDPQTAYKAKQSNSIIFYISDNEKENPHAPYDAYHSNKVIPGGGYLLAVTSGGNKFYDQVWSSSSRYSSRKNDDRNLI